MSELSRWQQRKQEIIDMASGPDATPVNVTYTEQENKTWQTVLEALDATWDGHVAQELIVARDTLDLPTERVPQLGEVSEKLSRISGFEYRAVGGLALASDFFGGLAQRRFPSTQFLRDDATPLYTPEPDIVHEVVGHGTQLAHLDLAELHELAGKAHLRMEDPRAKKFMADVWWFSGEFGVVKEGGAIKALGAGLLSSVAELQHFQTGAEFIKVDPWAMGQTKYYIDEFQETLFVADSTPHLTDTVASFFEAAEEARILTTLQQNQRP